MINRAVLIVCGLAIIVVCFYVYKRSIHQGWSGFSYQDMGMGYYSPVKPNDDSSKEEVSAYLKGWFAFISKVKDPRVVDYIYNLCPSLESLSALSYYNVTRANITTLKSLQNVLSSVDPSSLQTKKDVDNVLAPVCAGILNDTGMVLDRTGGLYPNIPSYNYAEGVI